MDLGSGEPWVLKNASGANHEMIIATCEQSLVYQLTVASKMLIQVFNGLTVTPTKPGRTT